ncbi:MAG: hypothetical protein WA919_05460 [Coleofasciculaceae cyanobacterium]
MKKIIFRPGTCLVGLVAWTLMASTMPVQAEIPSNNSLVEDLAEAEDLATTATPIPFGEQLPTKFPAAEISQENTDFANWQIADLVEINQNLGQEPSSLSDELAVTDLDESTIASESTPESLETSAEGLTEQPADSTVAQRDFDPGRTTRGGSSYIGAGLNLGLSDGGTPLGDIGFVINSKIGLTSKFSVRPAVIIADDIMFLVPVTYDFVTRQADPFEPVRFAPFAGAGIGISTDDDNDVGFLLTGGVDVPLTPEFVANASVNVGFFNDTDIGIILGVGYTFSGF